MRDNNLFYNTILNSCSYVAFLQTAFSASIGNTYSNAPIGM
jgi:hypothetical protein